MSYGESKIGTPWRGYYITAYGIAVKHGFKGTEEEWLESLVGKAVEIRYNDVTNVLEWSYAGEDVWTELLSLEDLQTEIVAQTLAQAEAAKQAAQNAQTAAEAAQSAAEAAQQEAEQNAGITQADASITQTNVQLTQEAKTAAEAAQQAAQNAQQAAEAAGTNSEESATLSKSWAVGGTGTRPGEDTNNAEYWAKQAAIAAGGGVLTFNGRTGNVTPEQGDYTPDQVGAADKTLSNLTNYQNALRNIGGRPNKNIAKNERFKINQRNFSSDNWTSGYGPDGWISIGDGHLEYSGGAVKTANQYLLQYFEPGEIDAGIYTISAFCTGEISGDFGFYGGKTVQYNSSNYENGLASATVEITPEMVDPIKNGYLYILCQNNGTISRVKVEKSQNQTLAYKKADGNWEPIDSEEYEKELAGCQRQLLDITPNITYNDSFVGECGKDFASFCIPTPVTMRAVPVFIGDPSKIQISASNGAFPSTTEVRVVSYGENFVNIRCIVTEGDLDAGMTCNLRVKDENAKLLLSAEL